MDTDIDFLSESLAAAGTASPGMRGDVIERVLVIDDSRLQRRILTASLGKWGFDVETAESGEAALEICRDREFDLIICDWMMKIVSGVR